MKTTMLAAARAAGVLGVIGALAGPAVAAEEIPDLVGTWKGGTQAVHIGPNPYRVPETNGANFGDNVVEFTYVIKEQVGTRFSGETEGKFVETIIGALKPPDYRSGIFLDNDGQYDFTLRDDDTIDMCYWHLYPASKVVSCWTITRQP